MTTELKLLAVAILIGIAAIFWGAYESRRQQGLKWAGGPRDQPRPVTGRAARLERALANYQETFPLFAAAVLAAHVADALGPLTLWGAWLYVVGRAAHLPFYAFHVGLLRTLAWAVSLTGLGLVIVALFV